jgi:hypothetical protein
MSERNEALGLAYKQLCEELSGALYDEDPAGMGRSAGAPRDEYDGEAARMAAALRGVRSLEEIASRLRSTFGECSPSLLERVERAFAKFRIRSDPAVRTHDNEWRPCADDHEGS